MGHGIMIYVSDENAEKLKAEGNRSALINGLLADYFKVDNLKKLSLGEIEKKKKILEIELEAEIKKEEVKNG